VDHSPLLTAGWRDKPVILVDLEVFVAEAVVERGDGAEAAVVEGEVVVGGADECASRVAAGCWGCEGSGEEGEDGDERLHGGWLGVEVDVEDRV
jgi:hypothetical protein